MRNLFNWAAARIVAAFALVLPLAALAAEPVAVWDGDFNDLTKFTGYELVDWNQTHGENNSTVTIDRANQGLMFNAESAMPGITIMVRYSNLTVGSSKKVLFTSCVNSNHSGYRTGVRLGTDGKICGMWQSADNGTASGSVPESGVMAFTYSTAGTYLYAAEKGTERLVQVWGSSSLKSSNDTEIYGGSAGGFCDGSSISGFSAATGMTIEALAVFNSVVSLSEMQEYIWPAENVCSVARTVAADATVNWADAAWTVGETADQTFTPSSDALYNATVTVGGDCTIVMPGTIGAFNRRKIKFVLDDGVGSATVALKYTGTLPETGSSVELDPFGDALVVAGSGVTLSPAYNGDTAGYMVSVSGLTVTIVKGSNYEGTLTADTNWSDIKPEGWANAIAGNEPSIVVNYEGEEPITLTFDEAVTAGSLTITGNIVVVASAAATFGTITAGSGSVVEMANVTVTTQAGAGLYRYRSNYPSTVPNNSLTYEYVGTADPETPGTVNLNNMRGTVRTTGYMSITGYYPLLTNAKLDVVSGTTTLTAGGQAICGYITIREGATLVNTATDSLAYSSYNSIIDIYGTLDMGTSRWTVWSGATFNLRGGEITGVGEGNNGAIDLMGTCNIIAYADSTISANIKFRNALSNITVSDGVTLTISGITKPGYDGGGITKKGAGTLKFTSDPYVPGGIVVEAGTLAFDTQNDVDPVVTYTAAVLNSASMDYAVSNNWKGTVVVSAVAAGTTATQVALNKTGNANSYLTLTNISGNAWCAGSNYTVQPAITLAGDVNFQNGSSNKSVTFRKIAAGTGNLSLKSWSGCQGVTYGFTTLDADNYTGTIQLDGSVLTFNVGDIIKAGASAGDKVLPLTVANNATVNLAGATLNGAAANLELKEDGIYLKAKTATITYADSTTEDSYDALFTILETLYTGYTPAKAGAVVTVLDGSDESFGDGLPAIYDYDSTEHTYTLKTMVVAYQVGMTTYYSTSLESVVEAAVLSDVSATLLVDLNMSSLPAGLVVPGSYGDDALHAITLDLGGKTITGPASGYALVNAGADITITGDGSVEGAGIVSNATSTATTTISGGTYTATGDLFAAEEGSTISVSGGTYNKAVDDEYLADGYEVKDNGNGTYGIREDKGWIYEDADYPGYTGSWATAVDYDEFGRARIEDGNTYTAAAPSAGQLVTLDMKLSFDGINDDDDEINDAKAAVRLGAGANDGEFVFQLYTSDNSGSKWVDVSADGVTATTNEDFTFTFVLDMTNRTYTAKVGGVALADGDSATTFAFAGANASDSVQTIEFTGAGTVTSIVGDYEDAPPPADEFVDGDTFDNVTLTADQASWLNAQDNYAALAAKLTTMTQTALDTAYLLNLNVLSESYDGAYTFTVTNIAFGKDAMNNETVVVTVVLTRNGALDGGINGTLKLKGGTDIGTFSDLSEVTIGDEHFADGDTTTCTFEKGANAAEFYQAVIE